MTARVIRLLFLVGAAAVLLLAAVAPARAQESTPTPEPWPTPIVTEDYILRQEVTYGERGIIVALFIVAGLLFIDLLLKVTEKLVEQ